MSFNIAEKIYLHIQCPNCSEGTLKPVAWLVSRTNMTCKGCSAMIDLKALENRVLIMETENHCAHIEAALKKESEALGRKRAKVSKPQRKAPNRTATAKPKRSEKTNSRSMLM